MTDTGTPRTQTIVEIQETASAAATPEVIVLPTLSDAARRVCQGAVRILAAAVTSRGVAHPALTGGSGGIALSKALAPLIAVQPGEARRAIHLWFGDECFVSAGGPERDDLLATPLIAAGIRESWTHRLATPSKVGGLDEVTARMAYELMSAGVAHGGFDVVHVELGLDAHVCSLFPGHPVTFAVEAPAVAMRNSPKLPPERYSLAFDVLQHAGRVMMVTGGEGKTGAVHLGPGASDVLKTPASYCRGKQIAWYLDEQASALATD